MHQYGPAQHFAPHYLLSAIKYETIEIENNLRAHHSQAGAELG